MIEKITAIFGVFRAGREVANPAAWKNAQLVCNLLVALVALAAAFGFDLGLSDAEIAGGAAFITAVVNGILVVATSEKVGLPDGKNGNGARVDSVSNGVRQPVRDSADAGSRSGFDHFTDRNG